MTLKLEMNKVVAAGAESLAANREQMREFVKSQVLPEGGFADRAGQPDLYYTIFGLELSRVFDLPVDLELHRNYLLKFADGVGLDLVHVCCLARCWATLGADELPADLRDQIVARVLRFRAKDGGFSAVPGNYESAAFATFLACDAMENLGAELPEPQRIVEAVLKLESDEGGFSNSDGVVPTTPSTAAACLTLATLGADVPESGSGWIMKQATEVGSYRAGYFVLEGDLLSTATALHTLCILGLCPDATRREKIRQYVLACQNATGGFGSYPGDQVSDCEYLYYGLLALGNLGAGDAGQA